jgi:hypothetical protein
VVQEEACKTERDEVTRNVFENNEPELTPEVVQSLDGTLITILPSPPEGYRYEITLMGDGRVAVVLKEG